MYVFRPGVFYSSVLSVLYNVYVVLVHTLYYVGALVKDDAFFIQCIVEEIRTYKQIIFFGVHGLYSYFAFILQI